MEKVFELLSPGGNISILTFGELYEKSANLPFDGSLADEAGFEIAVQLRGDLERKLKESGGFEEAKNSQDIRC